jgi:hypothetical protein
MGVKTDAEPVKPEFITPPKQVIMYHVNDEDPNRLYTLARLEDATIDKIADRVIAKLDVRREKVVDLVGKKRRKK